MDGPLSLPIVIPQQRPGTRSRGFIACYSPALAECGIDQKTFLKFLDDANTAMRGNKLLAGVEAAAFGVGITPEVMTALIATAVEAGAYVANKGYIRRATNSALDKYNAELFAPRGLFCMIMKYSPAPIEASKQKLNKAQSSNSLRKTKSPNSSSRSPITGTTNGPMGLPMVAAPLVFMDDRRQHREFVASGEIEPQKFQKATKPKTMDSLNDWFDRRARARYAAENAGDILSVPVRGNRLNGNHAPPTTSGGGILGKFKDPERNRPQALDEIDEAERRMLDEYRWQVDRIRKSNQHPQDIEWQLKRCEDYYGPQLLQLRDRRREFEEGKKRKIKKNILYLTIVNRPTDAQLAVAMGQIHQNPGQYGHAVQL